MHAAPLDNPRYYLANFDTLLDWVCQCHSALLTPRETATVNAISALPEASRALLVRLMMRKGDHFELARLSYPEIGDIEAASLPLTASFEEALEDTSLCLRDTSLPLESMLALSTLPRLKVAFPMLPRAMPKRQMPQAITALLGDIRPRPLHEWLGEPDTSTLTLSLGDLPERLSLMYFGNLRQTLSDFVLSELGLLRCEPVVLSSQSRAFTQRWEVDHYLALEQLRKAWQEAVSAPAPPLDNPADETRADTHGTHKESVLKLTWQAIVATLEDESLGGKHAESASDSNDRQAADSNAWLTQRRDRLRFSLARDAERQGWHHEAACEYAKLDKSGHASRAMPRRVRALELSSDIASAHALASERLARTDIALDEQLALERALPRLCRGLVLPVPKRRKPAATPQITIEVPSLAVSAEAGIYGVERAVAHALATPESPVFYVENGLIPALFTLLCWEVIFAPLPGAFFHAFHSGPADLYRPDFVTRREAGFEACFASLHDGSHTATILARHQQKQGIQAPFVHWEILSQELLTLALDCIPAAHLEACFRHLMTNPREHRAGLPDLIQFFPHREHERYRMIEVKAPTDRLQDNQRQWLTLFARHAIPALECRVQWQAAEVQSEEAPHKKAPGEEASSAP